MNSPCLDGDGSTGESSSAGEEKQQPAGESVNVS